MEDILTEFQPGFSKSKSLIFYAKERKNKFTRQKLGAVAIELVLKRNHMTKTRKTSLTIFFVLKNDLGVGVYHNFNKNSQCDM